MTNVVWLQCKLMIMNMNKSYRKDLEVCVYHVCVCVHMHMCAQLCLIPYNPTNCSPPGSCHGIIPGKDTGVSCLFLLQGIFQTQRPNRWLLRLLHGKADSLPLSHLGSILYCFPVEWTLQLNPISC